MVYMASRNPDTKAATEQRCTVYTAYTIQMTKAEARPLDSVAQQDGALCSSMKALQKA